MFNHISHRTGGSVTVPSEIRIPDQDASTLDARSFLDHELDLWCNADGAGIVDQDELDAAEADGQVSVSEAETARLAADELYQELRSGCGNAFAGLGWSLLQSVRGRPADEA